MLAEHPHACLQARSGRCLADRRQQLQCAGGTCSHGGWSGLGRICKRERTWCRRRRRAVAHGPHSCERRSTRPLNAPHGTSKALRVCFFFDFLAWLSSVGNVQASQYTHQCSSSSLPSRRHGIGTYKYMQCAKWPTKYTGTSIWNYTRARGHIRLDSHGKHSNRDIHKQAFSPGLLQSFTSDAQPYQTPNLYHLAHVMGTSYVYQR